MTTTKSALNTDDMVVLRDTARVPIQQAIEVISEGVIKEHFAVSSLLEARFRRALTLLLQARDELH
jgi:glycine betaine/choline ABC-type transport system substrate-binding protein